MKRAQAAPAASLLALIAVFVLLYILLIPPDMRAELLGDSGYGTKDPDEESPSTVRFNKTVFVTSPGRIDYLKFSEYEHPLPAVNLYTTSDSEQRTIGDSVYVKNGIFDRKDANLSFSINEEDDIQNVLLSFKTNPNRNSNGILTVKLNGEQLINKQVSGNVGPIEIQDLRDRNVLSFSVSGVGYRFWTTNEYELDDIQLFYDTVDTSTQMSRNTFMVTDVEKFNLESATFTFFPDCNPRSVGRLTALINSHSVYSAVPDCGQLNRIELSPSVIEAGMNKVTFESEQGQYLIDQITVDTELKSMSYPTYYFDLPNTIFSTTINIDDDEENCGDVDGICPKDCDTDLDMDCCFEKTSGYWCDYQPYNEDDRCRSITSSYQCDLCASGYEDSDGEPPEECEELCGDDEDGECPEGCSIYLDKDCCYEYDEENFWCNEIPKHGLPTCKFALSADECDSCQSGWESDESDFTCPKDDDDTTATLKSRYDVKLVLKFLDDHEKKAGKVFINGYQFHFMTYDEDYERNIDNYIEDGTNAVKIEPDQTVLEIRQLIVEIED